MVDRSWVVFFGKKSHVAKLPEKDSNGDDAKFEPGLRKMHDGSSERSFCTVGQAAMLYVMFHVRWCQIQ